MYFTSPVIAAILAAAEATDVGILDKKLRRDADAAPPRSLQGPPARALQDGSDPYGYIPDGFFTSTTECGEGHSLTFRECRENAASVHIKSNAAYPDLRRGCHCYPKFNINGLRCSFLESTSNGTQLDFPSTPFRKAGYLLCREAFEPPSPPAPGSLSYIPDGFFTSRTGCGDGQSLTSTECQNNAGYPLGYDAWEVAEFMFGCHCYDRFPDSIYGAPHCSFVISNGTGLAYSPAYGQDGYLMCKGTAAPTSAPTTAPTSVPTSAPTAVPITAPPTAAPISAPWTLTLENVTVDFNTPNAAKSVELKYEKGAGRHVAHELVPGDCGGNGSAADAAAVVTTTNRTTVPEAGTASPGLDFLTLRHEFDMSELASSALFDNATETINFCQDFGLVHEPKGVNYLITQVLTQVSIKLNMTAGFSVDVRLDDVEVGRANETVQLKDFISAYQCEGVNMVATNSTLKPNAVLNICIKSSSEEVEIARLDAMSANGNLDIIANDGPVIAAITDLTKTSLSRVVSTRLPVNRVTFAEGSTVTIAGRLTLQLKGSTPQARRRLAGAAGLVGRQLQAANEEVAPFAVAIELAPEDEALEPVEVIGTAAAAASASAAGVALSAAVMALSLAW